MGAIDGCVYTFILLVIRLILKVINKSNKKRVIIVGPKEDAQILSKKMIKENKNNVLSDMFSMKKMVIYPMIYILKLKK